MSGPERNPFHDRNGGDVAEEQITAIAHPDRAFGELKTPSYFFDCCIGWDNFVDGRVQAANTADTSRLRGEREKREGQAQCAANSADQGTVSEHRAII